DNAFDYNNLGLILRDQKKLDEAVAALRKAVQILPTADYVQKNLRRTEEFLESKRRLPDLLSGKTKPASPQEHIEIARFCLHYHEHTRVAVAYYVAAFLADPKLSDDLKAQHRYNAACAAALAASDKGAEAANL